MHTTASLLLATGFQTRYQELKSLLPSALLLTGYDGVGLHYLAQTLAPHTEITLEPHDNKGAVDSVNGSISIETVRELYTVTRGGSRNGAQVLIIDAERMTVPAQQAFLKLLEEPPHGISFILTSHHPEQLLATIRSRLQITTVPLLSEAASRRLLDNAKLDATTRQQLLFVANGRPGLLTRLLENPRQRDELVTLMHDARQLISGSPIDRLTAAFHYSDRRQALRLLDAALLLADFTLSRRATIDLTAQLNRLLASHSQISAGGNVRLNLLQTML